MAETQKTTPQATTGASIALESLTPIIILLDAAHATEDGENYQALVEAARKSAHAVAAILRLQTQGVVTAC